MSCEHLVCGTCAGPVDQGRCPSCRAARAHVHHPPAGLTPQLLVLLVALLLVLSLAASALH